MVRRGTAIAALAALALGFEASSAEAVCIETLALSGEQAPGAPSGATFRSFSIYNPPVNDAGQVAFRASLQPGTGGVTSLNNAGIWGPEQSGELALLARTTGQAPGATIGASFGNVGFPSLSDAGGVAFWAQLTPSGSVTAADDTGIWGPDGLGGVTLLAREGSQAPGVPAGAVFDHFVPGPVSLGNAGVAFEGDLLRGIGQVTERDDNGIWGPDGSGGLTPVVRENDQAPGTPAGAVFEGFFRDSITLNDAGYLSFRAGLRNNIIVGGGGVTNANNHGIWGTNPDFAGLRYIARAGDTASGPFPGGTPTYRGVLYPRINGSSSTLFAGLMNDGGAVTAFNNSGLWLSRSIRLIVREGEQAPGAPVGTVIADFPAQAAAVNDAEEVAFVSGLRVGTVFPAPDLGVFGPDGSGGFTLLAITGEAVPDLGGASFLGFGELGLNEAGDVAFHAEIEEDLTAAQGIFLANASGLFATLAKTVVVAQVTTGGQIEVAPGDFRTVTEIGSPWPGERLGSMVNESREVAFRAAFADGSEGIFLASNPARPAGDVGGNGVLDVTDVVKVQNGIVGNVPLPEACGDVNDDGDVNVLDVVQMLNMIVGTLPSRSCCV